VPAKQGEQESRAGEKERRREESGRVRFTIRVQIRSSACIYGVLL
jgi:hypothetical protein